MGLNRVEVEVYYSDGTTQMVGISIGTMLAYEVAFDKIFLRDSKQTHAHAWVTWRECQKINPSDTPSFEDWAATVDWLNYDFTLAPKEPRSG